MAKIYIETTNAGTMEAPGLTVPDTLLPATCVVQQANNNINITPVVQVCAGSADVVTFANATNIAIFTSTGPDAATLAVPGAGDVGKVLFLINDNTTQNVVTTTANKIRIGTASTYDTLTAPAHGGAVCMLIASNGFWNVGVLGTGTWVLSEV